VTFQVQDTRYVWPTTRPEQERVLRRACLLLWGETAAPRKRRKKRTAAQQEARRNHAEFTARVLLPRKYTTTKTREVTW